MTLDNIASSIINTSLSRTIQIPSTKYKYLDISTFSCDKQDIQKSFHPIVTGVKLLTVKETQNIVIPSQPEG